MHVSVSSVSDHYIEQALHSLAFFKLTQVCITEEL